jgi:phage baseplate assembly protein W
VNITEALGTDLAHSVDFVRTASADLGKVAGLANLKQALFHRLLTMPGTLAHRPTYGVGISMFQNTLSSFSIQQRLATLIQEQFKQDPRVEDVLSVAVSNADSSPQLVMIAVSVKVVGYGETTMNFIPFGGSV